MVIRGIRCFGWKIEKCIPWLFPQSPVAYDLFVYSILIQSLFLTMFVTISFHVRVPNNVWFNQTSSSTVGGTSTFPGGCTVTGQGSWRVYGEDCTCRDWSQWKGLGYEASSLWMDPKLTGSLKLVAEPSALALGIQPLHELSKAGADWEVPEQAMTLLI